MTGYKTREVAELVGMTPPQVRAYARTGILSPSRGPRRAYYFTFQDLVLLKTAKELEAARIPAQRIRRVLHSLSQQLPDGRSLTEVSITAEAASILVDDGGRTWNPESGQLFFEFVSLASNIEPPLPLGSRSTTDAEGVTAEGFFQMGCELEAAAPAEAREAYTKALEIDPGHAGSHVNLGRLVQAEEDYHRALDHYTAALISEPDHAIAQFNMASIMEQLERPDAAVLAYHEALDRDPSLSEAHYRLAVLYEREGRKIDALRHLKQYRSLVRRH